MKHLILVAMAFCLAACGGGGSSTPTTVNSSSSSSVVSSSSSSESSSESSSSSQAQVLHLPIGSGIHLVGGNQSFSVTIDDGENYAPQNIKVNPGYDWTHVSWEFGHGWPLTEVWRSDQNSFATAEKIGETDNRGSQYADMTTPLGSTYYYWLRFVGEDGVPGPFASVDGNEGAALLQEAVTFSGRYVSGDIDPDGYVIAIRDNDPGIYKIDMLTGEALHIFDAPEALQAVAVSPDGVIAALSTEVDEFYNAPTMYRFEADGTLLSEASAIENFTAIDFDANGELYGFVYGSGIRHLKQFLDDYPDGQYRESSTVIGAKIRLYGNGIPYEVRSMDISASNELRLIQSRHGSHVIDTYSLEDWSHTGTSVIMSDFDSIGLMVYR